jgi:flagellar protein FliO/FliZ
MTPGVDVGNLSNVVMSLALVVAFIFGAAYVVRRTPFGAGMRRGDALKVVAALPLGPKERLLLVEARGEELLIAVSPAGVFNLRSAPMDRSTAADEPVFALGEQP